MTDAIVRQIHMIIFFLYLIKPIIPEQQVTDKIEMIKPLCHVALFYLKRDLQLYVIIRKGLSKNHFRIASEAYDSACS